MEVFHVEEGFFVLLGDLNCNYKADGAGRRSVSCVIISPAAQLTICRLNRSASMSKYIKRFMDFIANIKGFRGGLLLFWY